MERTFHCQTTVFNGLTEENLNMVIKARKKVMYVGCVDHSETNARDIIWTRSDMKTKHSWSFYLVGDGVAQWYF